MLFVTPELGVVPATAERTGAERIHCCSMPAYQQAVQDARHTDNVLGIRITMR